MSGTESDRYTAPTLMHSFLQAKSVAEMVVMNHWPAVIEGVLKEILDHFHFQSLWSAGASWQLTTPPHPPQSCCYLKTEIITTVFSLKEHKMSAMANGHMLNVLYLYASQIYFLYHCEAMCKFLFSNVHLRLSCFTSLQVFHLVQVQRSVHTQGCMAGSWNLETEAHLFSFLLFVFYFYWDHMEAMPVSGTLLMPKHTGWTHKMAAFSRLLMSPSGTWDAWLCG